MASPRGLRTKSKVGCLLIPLLVRDGKILMLQKEKGRHLGQWLFPGGEIQSYESALDTIKREILNDIGLELDRVHLRGIVHFIP